jgi:PAS domain S-box-containing protein
MARPAPQQPTGNRSVILFGVTGALLASVFALDAVTALGVGVWLLYAVPVLLAFLSERPGMPLVIASVASLLIAVGFFVSAPGIPPWQALLNRLFGVAVLWLTAAMMARLRGRELEHRRSEERYRTVSELTADYTYALRVDADGDQRAEWVTGAFERITGYRVAELEPRSGWMSFIHPEDRKSAAAHRDKVLSGHADTAEFRIITKAGEERWLCNYDRPTWDPTLGRVVRIHGAAQDVTERKRAEEAAREAGQFLRQVISSAQEGIVVYGKDLHYQIWNPFMEELSGVPAAEVLGRHPLEVFPFLQENGVYAAVERALAGEATALGDMPYRLARTGMQGWVSSTLAPLRDTGGAIVGVISTLRDITGRKQVEEAVRTTQTRLLQAEAHAHLGSWELDMATERGWWSPEMYRLFERDPALGPPSFSEFLGMVHPEDRSSLAQLLAQAAGTAAPLSVDLRTNPERMALRDLNAIAAALRDAEGKVVRYAGSVLDITNRKRAEAEHERLRESLRRSELMAAMGSLVAGVAHEVRNPLFGISATLDAFEARFGSEGQQHLHVLREQIQRLNDLMRDLLDYGKPQMAALTPGSLAGVVAEGAGGCAALAEQRRVAIEVDVGVSSPAVAMDRDRMRQVIQNLVQNAVQLSPAGGRVRVSTRVFAADGRQTVECTVTDDGPGFRPEDLPHVLEPFYSRRHGGTGLGLAIAQRIVEQHGGTLFAANRAAGGAVLTVRLPAAE